MRFCLSILLLTVCAITVATATAAPTLIPDEDWGYVPVRPGANLFWWLYGSMNTESDLPRGKQPIVMWLQGGPGASSVAYGDFQEMGPLDVTLAPRNTTWVQAANILYLDQPVGTGWSYVEENGTYATTNEGIAADVLTLVQAFLAAYPDFQTAPFFIFSESYGGKMTATIATVLLAAVDKGTLKMNFRGVALGDSWVNGIDYVTTWGPLLRSLSEMTAQELNVMNALAVDPCAAAVAAGNWTEATNLWSETEGWIETFSCVNFYNSLQVNCDGGAKARALHPFPRAAMAYAPPGVKYSALQNLYSRHVGRGDPIDDLMNGPIRRKLNSGPKGKVIPDNIKFGKQSGNVFAQLSGDFMKPVMSDIDSLLAGGRINVTVYEGQLDLICASVGAELWMSRLSWPGMAEFYKTSKTRYSARPGATDAFRRSYKTLSLWYVMRAGHMVPSDNGDMALLMLKTILKEQSGI